MGRSPPHKLHGLPSMKNTNGNERDPTGPRYWKSLDDLAETPAFRSWLEREFPEEASMLDGVQRRGFMKVMAASFGLAGFGITEARRYFGTPQRIKAPRLVPLKSNDIQKIYLQTFKRLN